MRSKFPTIIVLFVFASSFLCPALATQDLITSENARNTFMNSRPEGLGAKQQSGGARGNRGNSNRAGGTQTRRGSGGSASGGRGNSSNSVASSRANSPRRNAGNRPQPNAAAPTTTIASNATNSFAPASIGLGYTLFMRDPTGNAARVDPSTNFRAGDHIRVNLESNIDGYLYIFHTENGANPQMLFPDARLNNGNNRIAAHIPYEVPSSLQANEEERWFVFDDNPATERLYIVVTREPLPSVPTEAALMSYCNNKPQPCTWRPTDQVWANVKTGAADSRVVVNRSNAYGQMQTTDEREAATRGTLLTQSAPEPSVVRMNASSQTNLLVTMIDLSHR